MAEDKVAAALDEVRRFIARRDELFRAPPSAASHAEWSTVTDSVADSAGPLLAAVETVLKSADRWAQFSTGYDAQGECAEEIRRVVTATLLGEDDGNG